MNKYLLITLFLSWQISPLFAGNDYTAEFQAANQLYTEGKYQEALNAYKKIENAGVTAYELFYNSGNAHYKLNHVGLSIYYYEKAKLLNPASKDLLHNLESANLRVKDRPDTVPQSAVSIFFNKIIMSMSMSFWAIFGILLFIVSLTFLYFLLNTGNVRKRKIFLTSAFVVLLFSLTALSFTYLQAERVNASDTGIVLSPITSGMSAPGTTGKPLFYLYEGYKVTQVDQQGQQIEVKLTDGRKVWISKVDVRFL